MSLLGFVTGAASLFGGGGSDKGSTTNQNQYSSGNKEQASTATEAGKTSTKQNTSTTGKSDTTGKTTQTGATTGSQSSTQAGTTTNYSSDVLASLDAILTQQLGGGKGGAQQATDALAGRLQQIQSSAAKPAFDAQGYVSGITQAAKVASENDLDSKINGILSATGSSEGGNSMSALLANKLRGDSAANLAGITAQATGQAEQIRQTNEAGLTSQISGLAGDMSTNLANLLNAAKGGAQQTSGTGSTISKENQTQTGTTQTGVVESATGNTTQTGTSDTTQNGVTQVTESGKVTTKSQTKPKSGDLFDKILGAFGKSASAA